MTADATDPVLPYRFSIAAIDLRMLLQRLKPAFPKGKAALKARLAMEVTPGALRWVLPGAAAGTVVRADQSFRAEVPFAEVQWIAKEPLRDGEEILFEFGPGRMNYRGMGVGRPDITVGGTDESPETGAAPEPASVADPVGAVGLPLLAAYEALRQRPGDGQAVPAHLRSAGQEVEAILAKAAKLLTPLGVGPEDLAALLDARLGLSRRR